MRLFSRLATLGLMFIVLAVPLGTVGAATDGQAAPDPSAPDAGVVGDGNLGSCDENGLHTALAGGGTVTFNCGGPAQILILNQQTITQPTTIHGGGLITITGGLATRLFFVLEGASLELDDLTLDGGNSSGASGGAIVNGGTLRLNDVRIQNSQTDSGHGGGAIYTFGPLFVNNSYFYNNGQNGVGGALYALTSDAVVEIHDTIFDQNHVVSTGGQGGAILVDNGAVVHVYGGEFVDNHSEGSGGAVYIKGSFTAEDSIFLRNTTVTASGATGRGFGGALVNTGAMTLTGGFVVENHSRYGGGLYITSPAGLPSSLLQNVFLVSNIAAFAGGGIYASSSVTATPVLTATGSTLATNTANFGGGLSIDNAAVTLSRLVIARNIANLGGGLGHTTGVGTGGLVRLYDSTIFSNVITTTQGGGIYNEGLMDLRNLTLEGNDGGVFNSGPQAVMTVANTVLHNVGLNCDGTGPQITSQGGNFSGDVSCGLGAVNGDVQGLALDPHLAPLAVSPVDGQAFFAPLPGSPLINTATFPCSPHDQLGALRPDACDKGAVEFHGLLWHLWLPLARRS